MKNSVAGSVASVRVVGRTDWEVTDDRNGYWANVNLRNEGGAGLVALRVALQASVQYVGIGASPSEPQYFQMEAGQTMQVRMTGTTKPALADRALGCVVEVYPRAADDQQQQSPLPGLP